MPQVKNSLFTIKYMALQLNCTVKGDNDISFPKQIYY